MYVLANRLPIGFMPTSTSIMSNVLSQRALGVLGHQSRFLEKHKAGLEKWTSDVYGLSFSVEEPDSCELHGTVPIEADLASSKPIEKLNLQESSEVGRTPLRQVRFSLKCKGADKRRIDKPLLGHVNPGWRPQHQIINFDKKSVPIEVENAKPPKRSKLSVAKLEQTVIVETSPAEDTAEEIGEDGQVDEASGSAADVPGAPGQRWSCPEESSFLSPMSKRQMLPEKTSLEAGDRPGQSAPIPFRFSGHQAPKASAEAGTWKPLPEMTTTIIDPYFICFLPRVWNHNTDHSLLVSANKRNRDCSHL